MAHNVGWRGMLKQTVGDLALVFPAKYKKRVTNWRKHVDVFAELKSDRRDATSVETRHAQAVACIEFLADHFRTLDTKFSSLLQFQALLMVVAGILNVLYRDQKPPPGFVFPLAAFILFWLSTTILCLLGAGWFFWGEMSGDLVPQAHEHVEGMIHTVIYRTAIFRYAWMLTFITVGVFLYFAGTISNWSVFGSLVNKLKSMAPWPALLAYCNIVSLATLIGVVSDESEKSDHVPARQVPRKKWHLIRRLCIVSFVLQLFGGAYWLML